MNSSVRATHAHIKPMQQNAIVLLQQATGKKINTRYIRGNQSCNVHPMQERDRWIDSKLHSDNDTLHNPTMANLEASMTPYIHIRPLHH